MTNGDGITTATSEPVTNQHRTRGTSCTFTPDGIAAMRLHTLLALLFLIAPASGNAQLSLDGLKERASKAGAVVGETAGSAVDAVGAAAGKATDAAKETVESTQKDLRDEATPEATRTKLDAMAETTLARLFAERPDSRELFEQSVGYAVFDTREASFYVVAGYGLGVAIDRRDDSRI